MLLPPCVRRKHRRQVPRPASRLHRRRRRRRLHPSQTPPALTRRNLPLRKHLSPVNSLYRRNLKPTRHFYRRIMPSHQQRNLRPMVKGYLNLLGRMDRACRPQAEYQPARNYHKIEHLMGADHLFLLERRMVRGLCLHHHRRLG